MRDNTRNSELLSNMGAEKAIAIKLIEENPNISFDDALQYAKDLIKNAFYLEITAEVDGKNYYFKNPVCFGCF